MAHSYVKPFWSIKSTRAGYTKNIQLCQTSMGILLSPSGKCLGWFCIIVFASTLRIFCRFICLQFLLLTPFKFVATRLIRRKSYQPLQCTIRLSLSLNVISIFHMWFCTLTKAVTNRKNGKTWRPLNIQSPGFRWINYTLSEMILETGQSGYRTGKTPWKRGSCSLGKPFCSAQFDYSIIYLSIQ